MTGALTRLRQDAVAALAEEGITAMEAFEPERRKHREEPVVTVSLAKVVCASGGFRDYLGLRYNRETGREEELYGRGVELTLALDIYAPEGGGESACRGTMDRVAEVLTARGIGGLSVRELESGQVEFLTSCARYRLPVKCRCSAWLVAAADESGEFADFIVKGRRA